MEANRTAVGLQRQLPGAQDPLHILVKVVIVGRHQSSHLALCWLPLQVQDSCLVSAFSVAALVSSAGIQPRVVHLKVTIMGDSFDVCITLLNINCSARTQRVWNYSLNSLNGWHSLKENASTKLLFLPEQSLDPVNT